MTKEELKNYITQLKLESDLENLIFELIDGAKEVNAAFLNGVADILDLQADFYEKVADVLEEEAKAYDRLDAEVNHIDDQISSNRVQEISLAQEELLGSIEEKIEEIKISQPPVEPTPTPNTTPQPSTAANI